MSESPTTSPSSVPSPGLSTLSLTDLKEVSDKDRQEAAQLKADANKAFLGHDFPRAAQLYSAAIDHNPGDATLFCNRAYTRIKLEEHGYALHDAARAIELNPKYAKAYYRRAMCHIQILKPQLAIADLKKVLALEPHNAQVRKELESTQKLVRKIEFEKAIEVEEEKSAVDRCLEIIAEDGKALPRRYAWEIVLGAHDHFAKEESLVDVKVDKEGQFFDVLHLLSLTGEPSKDHILLMNGDLVDRGSWSVEVILDRLCTQMLFPERMFINRGNHEAKEMNRTYGFEGEAKHKHGEQTYKLFAHVFTTLPLATLVSATQPPAEKEDVILSPDDSDEICRNQGVGIAFGPDVTRRCHEVRQDGYAIEHGGLCTTVFSAPNYVDQGGNKGAFIRIDAEGTQKYIQFEAQPHPDVRPMAYQTGGLANLMM
ncbi:phosphoprotein phosphatase [Lactarius deliciosus]|nr:phosphoprotein phosphatase [Lactarius deliciosus]